MPSQGRRATRTACKGHATPLHRHHPPAPPPRPCCRPRSDRSHDSAHADSRHQSKLDHSSCPENDTLRWEFNLRALLLSDHNTSAASTQPDTHYQADRLYLSAAIVCCPVFELASGCSSASPSGNSDPPFHIADTDAEDGELLKLWREWWGEANSLAKPSRLSGLQVNTQQGVEGLLASTWQGASAAPAMNRLFQGAGHDACCA